MTPAMHLHRLPPELLRLLLLSFDSLRDLYSLIQASSYCFRLFRRSPELILSSTVRRAIHPDALHHALAVIHVGAHQLANPQHGEALWHFLDGYFQHDSTLLEFRREMAGITSLARLHAQVSRLANDYVRHTLQALYASENTQQDTRPDGSASCYATSRKGMSATEQARVQRAFFRYELYSRCFPVNPRKQSVSIFPAGVQLDRFVRRMEPWEVEELSCLYEYFWVQLAAIFSNVEEEIVVKVLHAQNGENAPPRLSISNKESKDSSTTTNASHPKHPDRNYTSHGGDDNMCLFEYLDLRELDMFSEDCRRDVPDTIRYMVSSGLTFLESVLFAQGHERRDLIRRKCFGLRDFLPQAIELGPYLAPAPNNLDSAADDKLCHASPGYHLFRPSSNDVYLSAMGAADYWPLRRLGYVFWDIERVLNPEIKAMLRGARDCDRLVAQELFNRPLKRSAEARLKGIELSYTLMREIQEDYSYIFDLPFSDSEDEDYVEGV